MLAASNFGRMRTHRSSISRRQASQLLRQGLPPSKIAQQLSIPLGLVMAHLYRQVGEGEIRRSDILFTLNRHAREEIERLITERGSTVAWKIRRWLRQSSIDVDSADLEIYLKLRDSRVALGDMYELVRDLEIQLHQYIREALIREYGAPQWWREGVPVSVREDCAVLNERDSEPAPDLFCYTTVMHLLVIFDKQWNTLAANLPQELRGNKQEFLGRIKRLNQIRNRVMHPVKGFNLTEQDFDFLREFHSEFAQALHALQSASKSAESIGAGPDASQSESPATHAA